MIRDVKPPLWLINLVNPFTRVELRTPLARVLPWALLHFTGRRSGKAITVTVTWYETDDGPVVFSPNPWRANFVEPRPVTARVNNQRRDYTAVLVTDPVLVAAALNELRDKGTRLPAGLRLPTGERFTAEHVRAVNRAMLRFS